jgi:pimeloyl-ACP methyl ester carboxylesterase
MRELQLGDLRIAYTQAGHGPPLVLLHGGLDDSRSWRRQIDALADEFTVLAWDAPGCGRSSDVPESWRMPDYADALASWLLATGIEQPHILGLSWGSTIALELYRRHPLVPGSLILASPYAGWAGSLPPGEVAARLESVLAAAGLPRDQMPEGLPGVFSGRASPALRSEQLAIWADNAGGRNPGGYRAMAYSMAEADLRDVLPRIQVPTLLLHGQLDERAPLKVASDLHARIPASRLVIVEGVGHLTNVEAPDEFNAHVRQFIRSVVRA